MAEEVRAGWQSMLYYKDSTWKEINVAGDVDTDDSPEMLSADAKLDGVKRYIPGQVEGKVSFKLLAIDGEAAYIFLKAAALAKTAVELAWTDGDAIATTGTVYGRDWFTLTWKKGNPVNGVPSVDVEAHPAIKFVTGALVPRSYVTV
jgi:hypothetical protein